MPYKKCPCGNHPYYNVSGEKKPICCSECKTDEMINVKNKRCPCGKQPNFNVPGQTKGVCCKECKTDEMIDVVNRRCPCGKQPNFNVPGETKGVCCKDCKTDDMTNVKSKKCPCGKCPVYNVPEEKVGVCCSRCKTDEMIDVVNKKCPCGKYPVYNVPGEKIGVCCSRCKTAEMIDVVNKICPGYNIACPVRTYVSRGHEYCLSCDPNDDRRKRYKLFENAFFDYVKDKLDVHKREFHVHFDPVDTAKKFARVDGIVFGDDIIVCIEVDENGHQEYECDEHRMHLVAAELLQKYPEHVVSWVRVNPTVGSKNEWDDPSKKKREKRFEEVVETAKDILKMRDICVKYIGFD